MTTGRFNNKLMNPAHALPEVLTYQNGYRSRPGHVYYPKPQGTDQLQLMISFGAVLESHIRTEVANKNGKPVKSLEILEDEVALARKGNFMAMVYGVSEDTPLKYYGGEGETVGVTYSTIAGEYIFCYRPTLFLKNWLQLSAKRTGTTARVLTLVAPRPAARPSCLACPRSRLRSREQRSSVVPLPRTLLSCLVATTEPVSSWSPSTVRSS